MTLPSLDELIAYHERALPRYTSYPTAPNWEPLEPSDFAWALTQARAPFSLYLHIPFCERMCRFCGCSVVLNRKKENEEHYTALLQKELFLIAQKLPAKSKLSQLHFGGGTPTKIDESLLSSLMETIAELFMLDECQEIAIEIDPRTIIQNENKLKTLRALGFNRVSFGVQDIDPKVQAAIGRDQTLEMTRSTYHLARELGFSEINLDLIYGLPYQSPSSFQATIEEIIRLSPDRIALFSYAKIPHLKPHQKAIRDDTLPTTRDKFRIYQEARMRLIEARYLAIGMDHFAKKGSELALSYHNKTLSRNFQGYTVQRARYLIGCGMSSISDLGSSFFQNDKTLTGYLSSIEKGDLACRRGKILSCEDKMRRFVIESLMCRFEIDKTQFDQRYPIAFDEHFHSIQPELVLLENQGLIVQEKKLLRATPRGELFIRNIASLFDSYLHHTNATFSSSI